MHVDSKSILEQFAHCFDWRSCDTVCVMVDSTKLHKVVRKAMGHWEMNAMCNQSICQINWFFYYTGTQKQEI
jgi:hypothetical protein